MAYANGTTHYNLPLTVGSDKRDWADTNQAFSDLDAAVYAAVTDTGTQETEISALETRMDTAEQNISGNASDISALDTRLTTAEGSITSQAAAIDDVRSDSEDMICAYNEATATSTHAYAIGDYFIYNNVLYRATAGISIGDTIVPDTNCTTTNVTTELMSAGSDAVDMICTVTENTTTATRNYSVGDYFILNDVLYKVTATITVGTTIIPGTNCTSTNAMTEIKNKPSMKVLLDNSTTTTWGSAFTAATQVILDNDAYDAIVLIESAQFATGNVSLYTYIFKVNSVCNYSDTTGPSISYTSSVLNINGTDQEIKAAMPNGHVYFRDDPTSPAWIDITSGASVTHVKVIASV